MLLDIIAEYVVSSLLDGQRHKDTGYQTASMP